MKFLLMAHIQNAYQSLKSNRLRTFLTMLGICIGVASVTSILALGAGASQVVNGQVSAMGGSIAVVRPLSITADPIARLTQIENTSGYTASTLTDTDVVYLQRIPHVQAVAPIMVLTGAIKGTTGTAPAGSTIVATTPALINASNLQVNQGQFLDDSLNSNTAVIGAQLSVAIFGTEESIGQTVNVQGVTVTIIGVLNRMNTPVNFNGVDFDTSLIVNEATGRQINHGNVQIQQINIRSDSAKNLQQVVVDSNKLILQDHFGQADFSILTGQQISQPTSQLFYTIAGVTTAIAGISLLVGGIGIMNIMLVSVAERTREIGIRKALGASNGDILWQFMIESLGLSIGGGILGFIVGYGVAFLISLMLTFDPAFSWSIVGTAAAISLIVGVLFGIYPALRAAHKDPIRSLRQYD